MGRLDDGNIVIGGEFDRALRVDSGVDRGGHLWDQSPGNYNLRQPGGSPNSGLRPQTLDWPTHPEIEPRETRNLVTMAVHQVVFRIGWIFKTESVIVPAFVDAVAGPGWVRGLLPMHTSSAQPRMTRERRMR